MFCRTGLLCSGSRMSRKRDNGERRSSEASMDGHDRFSSALMGSFPQDAVPYELEASPACVVATWVATTTATARPLSVFEGAILTRARRTGGMGRVGVCCVAGGNSFLASTKARQGRSTERGPGQRTRPTAGLAYHTPCRLWGGPLHTNLPRHASDCRVHPALAARAPHPPRAAAATA